MPAQDDTKLARRNTRQRALVLSSVVNRCDHPTAESVYEDVRRQDEHISRATVYRNLHLLVESGSIISIRTAGGERFDRRTDDHAHVICEICGRVDDAPKPALEGAEKQAANETGYLINKCQVVYKGICPECQRSMRAGNETETGEG